jgi:hypothetical protein
MRRLLAFTLVALAACVTVRSARADVFLVSDVRTGGVLKYDTSNPSVLTPVFTDSQLNTPFGLTFGPGNNLYLDSLGTGVIYKYTPAQLSGGPVTGTPFITMGSGGLTYPNDLAFLPNGNVLVTSYATNQVLQYSSTGTPLGVYASIGLHGPTGLALDASGNLYVSSSLDNQILKYGPGGGGAGVALAIPPVDHPSSITIANGVLYTTGFAEDHPTASSVTSYNLTTGLFQQKFDSRLVNPAGIGVGSDGSLYVTSYASGQIFHLDTTLGIIGFSNTSSFLPTYITSVPSGVPVGNAPEPTSLALTGIGLALMFGYSRRCRRSTRAA